MSTVCEDTKVERPSLPICQPHKGLACLVPSACLGQENRQHGTYVRKALSLDTGAIGKTGKSDINGNEHGFLVSRLLVGKYFKTSQHTGEDIIRSSVAVVGDKGAGLQEQLCMPVESASCFLLVRHTLVIYVNTQRQVTPVSLSFLFWRHCVC